MRRLAGIMALTVVSLWVVGCARTVRQADFVDQAATKEVFTFVADGTAEAGKVDLVVRLSIKTHLSEYYLLESKKSHHGRPGYPFIVTIDGQTVVWREDGQAETTPEYDAKGIRTPEGGNGRRYILEKRVRLSPGPHVFEIDLPEEPYTCMFKVDLGRRPDAYFLELKPAYGRPAKQKPTFLYGVTRIDPYLDSMLLPLEER